MPAISVLSPNRLTLMNDSKCSVLYTVMTPNTY